MFWAARFQCVKMLHRGWHARGDLSICTSGPCGGAGGPGSLKHCTGKHGGMTLCASTQERTAAVAAAALHISQDPDNSSNSAHVLSECIISRMQSSDDLQLGLCMIQHPRVCT